MAATKNFDIAIIGGGIAGLTLGIALQKRNINVNIYERTHQFREIGAGVSFSPNAVQAMHICDPAVYDAFVKVATHNGWDSKSQVYFDYYNEAQGEETHFTYANKMGQNGLHRARFLDELVNSFPTDKAHFGKRLDDVRELSSGRLLMKFSDGTSAEADAVIGCDGIHSKVRELLVGPDHPAAHPTYSHKYAYRGLVPMPTAIEAIGEEKACNSCLFVGPRGHVLTFPINNGETMNVVAFYSDDSDWFDDQKLTRMARREDALEDFKNFGPIVKKVLGLCEAELSVWAIFDLGNPVPTFTKGRIAITGDAAHATSPHHGSGAGFAIEDSACLAELLGDASVQSAKDLDAVLAVYDATRRTRGQWLPESSRYLGTVYDLEHGDDMAMIKREVLERYDFINNVNLQEVYDNARKGLAKQLQ